MLNCGENTVDVVEFGTITGRVVKKENFEPIENAKIVLTPTNNTVFTGEDGYFTVNEVPGNDYSVSAAKQGFLTAFQPASISGGSRVNLVFELEIETALNDPPTQPELRAPTDGQEDLDTSVELSFKSTDPDEDPITYSIKIRNDFNNEVIEVNNLQSNDTLYTVNNLKFGARYFWQVGASDGINTEVLSTTQSFKITDSPNNRFFYVKELNGNNVIYSADFQNQMTVNELLLTDSSKNSWRPRKNSATNLIAFLRTDNNETHLFTMKTDGSEVTKVTGDVPVTSFNFNEVDFAWSSNGEKLIYSNFTKLYVINKDGSGLQEIYETTGGNYITECDWNNDGSKIALKTNNSDGYNASIYTINMSGTIIDTILTGMQGAAGGINFSIDNTKLLFTRDASNFESANYRQLDNRIYLYDFVTMAITDLSEAKSSGTNDLDPRFSPNEAEVIFVNTSNDGMSEKTIYKMSFGSGSVSITELFTNSSMPDWE